MRNPRLICGPNLLSFCFSGQRYSVDAWCPHGLGSRLHRMGYEYDVMIRTEEVWIEITVTNRICTKMCGWVRFGMGPSQNLPRRPLSLESHYIILYS